jgi:LuxR family maltose regulon positive regulatory protein
VYHRGQFSEIPALLGHLAVILENEPNQVVGNDLSGEISALRSLIAYHAGDAEGAISQARVALDFLPPELWIVRVMAHMYLGGALQSSGDEMGGYHAYYDALEGEFAQNKRFKATLLMTACYFHWLTADLQSMMQASKQSIVLCHESGYRQILGLANYQLGCVRYQQNDLHAAEELFSGVVVQPYRNYGTAYANSVCGLGMTYQALGKETEAREVTEAGIAFLLKNGIMTLLPAVLALQAELALMQGHISVASQWAEKLDPIPPLAPMYWFLAPHLTLAKVWLAQDTPASRAKAAKLIKHLQEYLEGTHNTRFLIETLATQALLEYTSGDQSAALASLERALRLAQPGGFIRLFLDLGPQMAPLLALLENDRELRSYVAQILSTFPGTQQKVTSFSQGELAEPLTNRELEILALLAERKTNKEIAMQLGITLGTVRQHSYNLYQKLEVGNRREAVARAVDLGVLTGLDRKQSRS